MEKVLVTIGALVGFAALIIVLAPMSALFGAIAGWTVQLFWGDTVLIVLRTMGLHESVTMWQLGATLGFVGGFLRTSVTQRTED